ncbi:MAG TPA: hypothetical protein PKC87_01070 [Candidatus Absconditabacterales bacterium]|nr:hypothetical protein [Candidatus Absconditabacterales bacterium]
MNKKSSNGKNEKVIKEEEEDQLYTVSFWVRKHDDKYDYDWDVMAKSPEDAIEKLKTGQAKGPYGENLPRSSSSFSAELKR